MLVDSQAHKTMYEGAAIARGAGATLHRVRSNDPDHLEQTLRSLPAGLARVFCIDGVNSMTGNVPDLPTYARICREYDTILYVDDAHGFGVIGESPTPDPALRSTRQQHRPVLRGDLRQHRARRRLFQVVLVAPARSWLCPRR